MTDLAARPHGRLAGARDALTPREWARAGAMAATIIGLNVLGWGMLATVVGGHYHITRTEIFGFGTGILTYTLGMRHAFDADHIAAIDKPTTGRALISTQATQDTHSRGRDIRPWVLMRSRSLTATIESYNEREEARDDGGRTR